jgi:protein SCO1/2
MNKRAVLRGRGAVSLLAIWLACTSMVARGEDAPAPRPTLDPDAALRISQSVVGKPIGDYTLLDRAGRPVRLADYRGKPLLVNFIYTGCFQVCPTSTRAISEALKAMGGSYDAGQFNVVSIGFNLPADSPQAMKAFAAQQRIDFRNWEFLSPHPSAVEALTRDFGFAYAPNQSGFDHLLQVTVVDAEGRVYRQVYGDDFSADRLGQPLRELLRDGPMPQTLSLSEIVDRVRVLCSVYDPDTGTYRVSYALAFEIAGGVTFAVVMVWFFIGEWRANRRLRRARDDAAMRIAGGAVAPPAGARR